MSNQLQDTLNRVIRVSHPAKLKSLDAPAVRAFLNEKKKADAIRIKDKLEALSFADLIEEDLLFWIKSRHAGQESEDKIEAFLLNYAKYASVEEAVQAFKSNTLEARPGDNLVQATIQYELGFFKISKLSEESGIHLDQKALAELYIEGVRPISLRKKLYPQLKLKDVALAAVMDQFGALVKAMEQLSIHDVDSKILIPKTTELTTPINAEQESKPTPPAQHIAKSMISTSYDVTSEEQNEHRGGMQLRSRVPKPCRKCGYFPWSHAHMLQCTGDPKQDGYPQAQQQAAPSQQQKNSSSPSSSAPKVATTSASPKLVGLADNATQQMVEEFMTIDANLTSFEHESDDPRVQVSLIVDSGAKRS